MDFKRAKELLAADDGGNPTLRDAKVAVIDILMAYGYLTSVDAFGDLPYTEALLLNENITPAYDPAASIYDAELANLRSAIGILTGNTGTFGGADVMFAGNDAAWRTFGASLLLRHGMRLADVSESKAQEAFTAAMNTGVFTSQAESGILHWIGVDPHVNPINDAYVIGKRKDYLPTNTIVDIMANHAEANHDLGGMDPRIDNYFIEQPDGGYLGATAGLDGAQSYQLFSQFYGDLDFDANSFTGFFAADFPTILIDYVEVEFLLAEAAARGFAGAGSAEEHYNNAVTASILYWHGTEAEAATYLALPGVAYDQAKWKERIGVQKWLALYNRGIEGWAEWRRLDFPTLNIPEGMVYNDIPKRMPYPYNEKLQNKSNWEAASDAIGGDDQRTPLFWDKF